MKKTTKTGLLACALLAFGFAMISGVKADVNTTTDVILTIENGNITHGISWDNASGLTLTTGLKVSNSAQTATGNFGNDSFRVDDQRWSESGWYTTLSVTDLTGQNNAAHVIAASNVKLTASAETFSQNTGIANPFSSQQTMDSVKTYLHMAANHAILGTYLTDMAVEVTVPANTPADTYKGIITYTLYEDAQPSA